METKAQRIKNVFQWLIFAGYGDNQEEIGKLMGYCNRSSLSQILNGRVEISAKFTNKLASLDPRINREWVETGEGSMIIETNNGNIVNQTNRTGDNNYNGGDLIDILKEQGHQLTTSQNQLTVAQEHINALLEIIKNKL